MFVFYAVYFLFRFFNSNQTTATMGKKRLKRDAKGRFLKEHSKKRRGTKRRRKRSRKSKRKNQKRCKRRSALLQFAKCHKK